MISIRNNIVTSIELLLVVVLLLTQNSCGNFLGVDSKPEKIEREIEFRLSFYDNSGFMQQLFSSPQVRGAVVTLKSNSLGTEYSFISDTLGMITVSGIPSDTYIISAQRSMSPEEMLSLTGTAATSVKLINKKTRIISLDAAAQNPSIITMDVTSGGSPLVISEIYACGPPGSGLYYHDKYIELYNQSDSVLYVDKLMIAVVYTNSNTGLHYRDDPEYVHSKNIWIFPGSGNEYPINPGQFILCAEDAIDHRMNAPNSVDLSHADFEFYKDDAPDIDNPAIANMIRIYQPSGNDWLIAGETGALVVAKYPADSLQPFDDQFLIPYCSILDGVEYKIDPTRLDKKILNEGIDAGTTGGVQFYTGKSMERKMISNTLRILLKDENNSSVDFDIIQPPTPGKYH